MGIDWVSVGTRMRDGGYKRKRRKEEGGIWRSRGKGDSGRALCSDLTSFTSSHLDWVLTSWS